MPAPNDELKFAKQSAGMRSAAITSGALLLVFLAGAVRAFWLVWAGP